MNKIELMVTKLYYQMMKLIPSTSGGILTNKWILYFIFVVGFYDAIQFYQSGNMVAFAIFFVVGFLTSFFSKNMTVIIVMSIAVAHLVAYGNRQFEGLENKDEEKEVEEEEEEEEEEGFEDEESEEAADSTEDKKVKKGKEEEETAENFESELVAKQNELIKSMDSLKPLLKSLSSSDKKVDGFATMDSLPKFADFK